jgi:hypothetical protein
LVQLQNKSANGIITARAVPILELRFLPGVILISLPDKSPLQGPGGDLGHKLLHGMHRAF